MGVLVMIVLVSYLILIFVPPEYSQRYGHATVGVTLGVWFSQVLHDVGHGQPLCHTHLQDGHRLWWMAFGLHRVNKQGQR